MAGISNLRNDYAINTRRSNLYSQIASGNKLQKAKNGAAELAILQKMNAQTTGLSVGTQNTRNGISALNIADSGMSGITDYLQDIRDLSLRAMNGLMSADDKQSIQAQIDQYKQGINDTVNQSKYNETQMLSGDKEGIPIVTNSDGNVFQITKQGSSASDLGLDNYDVTRENFDLGKIDEALSKVSSNRSQVGEETNGLEHVAKVNEISEENTVAAASRIGDTDLASAMMNLQQQNTLNQAGIMMQRREMETQAARVNGLLGM